MSPHDHFGLQYRPAQVKQVTILGIKKTNESLLKKQINNIFQSNNVENLFKNVVEAKERLSKLDVFKYVNANVDVIDNDDKGYKVTFEVEEKKGLCGELSLNQNSDGITQTLANMGLNNLCGRAEKAQIHLLLGSDKSFTKFATLSKPLEGNPYINATIGGTESTSDHSWAKFTRHERSVFTELDIETIFGNHILKWDAIWREIIVQDHSAPLSVLKESGPHLKCSLNHVFQSDSRPEKLFPDSGLLLKLSQQIATIHPGSLTDVSNLDNLTGSSTSDRSLQLKLENLIMKPIRLTNWLVAELTLSTGLTHSLTGHPVHIADRFFVGGPLELRGFNWRTVCPSEPLLNSTVNYADGLKMNVNNDSNNNNNNNNNNNSSPVGSDAYWLTGLHFYAPLPYWGCLNEGSFASLFRLHGFFLAASTMNRPICDLFNVSDDGDSCEGFRDNLGQRLLNVLKGKPRAVIGLGLVMRFLGKLRMEINYALPIKTQLGDQFKPGFTFGLGFYYM